MKNECVERAFNCANVAFRVPEDIGPPPDHRVPWRSLPAAIVSGVLSLQLGAASWESAVWSRASGVCCLESIVSVCIFVRLGFSWKQYRWLGLG